MLRYSISTSSTASTTSNSRSRLAAAALLLSMSTTKLLAAVAPSASPASPAASPLKQQQQQMCTRYEVDTKAWIYNDRKIHTPVTFPCESGSGGGTSSSLKSSPMTEHLISSSLGASQGSTASISSPFVINFQCGASNKTLCGYAQDSFKSAAARLASVLVINTPIYVLANFSSFCGGTTQVSNCQLAETLGQASPAAFFSASPQDTSNSWFYYPQALVKQLNKNVTLQYSTYDIVAEFNSDFNFWFKTSGQPIQSSQTDFEFVIAHELTHGLGFVTGYEQWSSLFTGLTSQSNYIAPAFSYNGNTVADAIVANWDPVNIFDRFIVDGQSNSISKYAKGIYQYANFPQSLVAFISGFEHSGSALNFAKDLYGLLTSGTQAIKFQAGGLGATSTTQTPYLQTFTGAFQQGSSIAHLDYQSNYQGPDFLMVPSIQNLTGLSLDTIISQNTNNGAASPKQVYGPGTLAIMSSIGWPTPSTPTIQSISINPNQNGGASFTASSGRAAARPTGLLLVIIVATVMMMGTSSF